MNTSHESLTAQALRAAAAITRIAELERELQSACERLTHEQNKAVLLEISLALKVDENLHVCEPAAKAVTDEDGPAECAHKLLEEMRQRLLISESEIQRLQTVHLEALAELARQTDALSRAKQTIKSLADLFCQLETVTSQREKPTDQWLSNTH